MLYKLATVCAVIFILLVVTELLWRSKRLDVEVSRKIVHMGTGVIVAFMPLFITYTYIQLLSIGFLLVVVISYRFHIFKSIHAVKRITLGEILYPVGIGVCAFLEPAPWMFTAAILHLALADSAASIAGHKWGKKTRYYIVTHGKSLAGSFAFFAVSFGIFLGSLVFVMHSELPSAPLLLGFCPLALTLLENFSLYGSDDITVPVAVIVMLAGLPA